MLIYRSPTGKQQQTSHAPPPPRRPPPSENKFKIVSFLFFFSFSFSSCCIVFCIVFNSVPPGVPRYPLRRLHGAPQDQQQKREEGGVDPGSLREHAQALGGAGGEGRRDANGGRKHGPAAAPPMIDDRIGSNQETNSKPSGMKHRGKNNIMAISFKDALESHALFFGWFDRGVAGVFLKYFCGVVWCSLDF